MGLLDDAIRDHLELKRRNGADLGEVAREEHDALAPIFDENGHHAEANSDAGVAQAVSSREQALDGQPEIDVAGQETAELDMQAVLEEDAGPRARTDDFEWRSRSEDAHVPLPGQERISFE